jgi:hypothetical protein
MFTKKNKPKLKLLKPNPYEKSGWYIELPCDGENIIWSCSHPHFRFTTNSFSSITGRLELEPLYLNLISEISGDIIKLTDLTFNQGKRNMTLTNVTVKDGDVKTVKTLLIGAIIRDLTINKEIQYGEDVLSASITIIYDSFIVL